MPPRALGLILVAAGALVVASIVGAHQGKPSSTWLVLLDWVAGALGLGLLVLLPRRPVLTTLALAVLSLASPALVPTSTLAMLHVARTRSLRTAAVVAVPGVLAHLLRFLWRPLPGLEIGWYALLAAAVYAALVAWGARGRLRDELLASLRERAEAAEAEQSRLVAQARRAERTRMAREMHDGLAHRLAMIATHAGALEFRPDAAPDRVAAAAGVVRTGIHEAMDELREVILLLRDDADSVGASPGPPADPQLGNEDPADTPGRRPLPTLADLPALVADFERLGVPVRVSHDPVATRGLPPPASRAAYRVVQEALANASRHAPGQPVSVSVDGQPGTRLTLEVANPMSRAEPVTTLPGIGAGFGLVGMRERVGLAGGSLHVAQEGSWFRLHAWLPWPDGATGARADRRR